MGSTSKVQKWIQKLKQVAYMLLLKRNPVTPLGKLETRLADHKYLLLWVKNLTLK
jgi:hypothetical protein